jgi:replicative DNA helicase
MSKEQPHNVEAEQAFLGSIEIDPHAIIRATSLVRPADFFVERHSAIYQAMLELDREDIPIDLVTLSDRLENARQLQEIGVTAYLTELMTLTPTSIHVEYYARLVHKYARLRRLIKGAGRLARLAHAGQDPAKALAKAETILLDLTQEVDLTGFRAAKEIMAGYLDRVATAGREAELGISTGLPGLDKLCGRLQKSDLVLVAGRPGMMKTALVLKIARSAAGGGSTGRHVAIFSLEMSDEQLIQRLIAAQSGISPERLRLGQIEPQEWPDFTAATQALAETSIHIDDTPAISVQELRRKARRLNQLWGIDLIIIDYLQLMRSGQKPDNRVQEVSAIGRALKALARELNVPVVAISILSRACELRPDKRPILSDLRESGTLEYEADIVWFCYRDELYYPDTELINILELIQAKWRHGPTGTIKLYCHKERQDFSDAEKHLNRLDDLAPVNDF